MNSTLEEVRQEVHELIDLLTPAQLTAFIPVLKAIHDPVSYAIANAPLDDEPTSEEEERDVTASKEWFKHNKGIPLEEILAEYGLIMEDFERMGRIPLPLEPEK